MPRVAALKWRALRFAFDAFKANPDAKRQQDFEAFRAERAPLLSRFACFEVLRHKFGKPWWEWPEEWRAARMTARMRRLAQRAGSRRTSNSSNSCNGCADRQLQCLPRARRPARHEGRALSRRRRRRAMRRLRRLERAVGDFAPSLRSARRRTPLNTAGQNWGLAGFNAAGLELQSFEPYREMLRASMRHAGAIRLDHVLGLKRLYLVPHGFAADERRLCANAVRGAAGRRPRRKASRNRCVVIGEDLGTVPEGFREQMAEWGIWSYQVMMFERDDRMACFAASTIMRPMRSSPSTPTICRPMPAGARSAISS